MSTPARFTHGLTTATKSSPLGNFGMPDPTKWHVFFDDFDLYVAADWTVTEIGTATQALTDGDGGLLLVTNSAADNDGSQNQKVGESFLMASGKKAFFKARFKVSDATQSDLLIGLAVLDTTLLGSTGGDGVTDGIFFYKDDGSTALNVSCQLNTTTGQLQATSIATVVSDTFMTVAWYYDGAGSLLYYIDDVHKGTLAASSSYLPDTELTVSFALLNGEAVAKTMTVDYLFAAKER